MSVLEVQLQGEHRLVEAAKADPAAFGRLYDRHVGRIYNYVYHHVGNRADAEDLTAVVFQKAFEAIGRYRWQGVPFSDWLYRIAFNVVAGHFRRRRAEVPLPEAELVPAEGPSPEEAAEAGEERVLITALLRRLPLSQQEALVLRYAQDLGISEIARVMGRSEGAIKQLIHRGLQTLRDGLEWQQ